MSGDETDHSWQGRRNQQPHHVVIIDWRNPEVLVFFCILDGLYFSTRFEHDGRIAAGRFPNTRIRSNIVVKGKVVRGLPANFYNPEWLKLLTPSEIDDLEMKPSIELNFAPETLKYGPFFFKILQLELTVVLVISIAGEYCFHFRIAARFMNIKHRQCIPLDNSHPAVMAAFKDGMSAPVFSEANPVQTGGTQTPTQPTSLARSSATMSPISSTNTTNVTTGPSHQNHKSTRFVNAEAGPSRLPKRSG